MRRLLCLVLVAAAWPLPAVAAGDESLSVDFLGSVERVDVYRPVAGLVEGAAIVAHGFARSRARHGDLARALAQFRARETRDAVAADGVVP